MLGGEGGGGLARRICRRRPSRHRDAPCRGMPSVSSIIRLAIWSHSFSHSVSLHTIAGVGSVQGVLAAPRRASLPHSPTRARIALHWHCPIASMLVRSACVPRQGYQPVVFQAAAGGPGAGSPGYRRSGGGDGDGSRRRSGSGSQRPGGGSSPKGAQFEGARRRRGRGASQFSPDDTPLRDGNRDRLLGLLTER